MTMDDILEGLLLINDVDVYARFGAFLAEKSEDAHDNYDSLMTAPKTKEVPEVSVREENGVRSPAKIEPAFEPRDIELQFAIEADSDADFITRYAAFIRFLMQGADGWLRLRLADVGLEYRVRYTGSSQYSQITPFGRGRVAAMFRVTLREPQPSLGMAEESSKTV